MPFSVKYATADSGKLIGPSITTMGLLVVLAGIHIIIRNNMMFVVGYTLILLVANVVIWKISFRISWKDIKQI
jgi:hypothetical protein